MEQRNFDDFDDFADDYRLTHTRNIELSGADSFYFAEMKVRLLQPFERNKRLMVLDMGCGDGATELYMQKYFPQWGICGVDVSEKSIEAARKREISNAVFAVSNATEIPLENESVDIVFIAGVLHHVGYHLHKSIAMEISRVLKKGGRLYLFEHNPLNPLTRYLVNTCVFDKDAKLLKSSYLMRLLVEGNFKIQGRHFIIFFPRNGIFSKLIFLERYLQWLPFGGQYFIRAIK
ncbi:MAG: class I SAM-dependent methyltransferase [Ferruginibacter sp.]